MVFDRPVIFFVMHAVNHRSRVVFGMLSLQVSKAGNRMAVVLRHKTGANPIVAAQLSCRLILLLVAKLKARVFGGAGGGDE